MKLFTSLSLLCLFASLPGCTIRDNPNDPASENFSIRQAPIPQFSKSAATYYEPIAVAIIAPEDKFSIYYTIDGTMPAIETAMFYDGTPILVSTTTTIKAVSYNDRWALSEPLEATFIIEPQPKSITISPTSPVRIEKLSSLKLTAILNYNNNTIDDITAKALWSSSDNTIAEIVENGKIKTLEQGEVTITATYGEIFESVIITIID